MSAEYDDNLVPPRFATPIRLAEFYADLYFDALKQDRATLVGIIAAAIASYDIANKESKP